MADFTYGRLKEGGNQALFLAEMYRKRNKDRKL